MRVLTVLEMLQTNERITGAELAARLEVHPRTVQRYIARLQDLGVPVRATRGTAGSYRLKPRFRLPPMMFTGEEALALTLGLRALSYLGLTAFAPATEGASAKLERVLPTALAARVREVQASVALDDDPWIVASSATRVLELASAIPERRVVRIEYKARDARASSRDVEPYGLVYQDGRWYLVGNCRLRQARRCFRVDRINRVERLEDAFTPPDGFDARAFLLESLFYAPSDHQVRVWIDLPVEAARRRFIPAQAKLEPMGSGTCLRCGVENLEWFAATLLMLDCRVVVHETQALREAFARVAFRAQRIAQESKA